MEPRGNKDLYEHAQEMCKDAWKRASWNREKWSKKLGFMLLGNFGDGVWTLKDLDDAQLLFIMGKANERLSKRLAKS
jgi:hypothetical protein